MTVPELEVQHDTAKKRETTGKFLVLEQITDDTWRVLKTNVNARSGDAAVRLVTVTGDTFKEGTFVGIPMKSWSPKSPQAKITVTLV